MRKDFRSFLALLEQEGELVHVSKETDVRYVSALIAKSDKALVFENLSGYDMKLAGGLLKSRRRLALAMGTAPAEIAKYFARSISDPIPPEIVDTGPVKQVIKTGDDVDLTELPIPLFHQEDGGPYISSGVGVAKDPRTGRNAGVYRMMFRTKNETGIDLVSLRDLRVLYEQAMAESRPLEFASVIGLHPLDILAASYRAPLGFDEFAIAGGLHGAPVPLVPCETVDIEVPADAEMVLEGEILPIGWTEAEGPFGEFTFMQGGIHYNPIVRIKAITHRKDPIFYALHMPLENNWLLAPALESAALRALENARLIPHHVSAVPGAACYYSLIASIKSKKPGEGKNALLALLSISDLKMAIVTDDDIDIYDRDQVDWALAFRVQADQDVLIIPGARADQADPSVRGWLLPAAGLPTTAKLGIDATIPEGIPASKYKLARYAYINEVDLDEYIRF